MANLDAYGNPMDGSDPFSMSGGSPGEVMGSGIGPGTAPSPDFGAGFGNLLGSLGTGLNSLGTGAKSIWNSVKDSSLLPLGIFGASMLAKPKAPDLTQLNDIAGLLKTNKTAGLQTSAENSPNFGAMEREAGILEGEGNTLLPSARTGHVPDNAGVMLSNNLRDAQNAIRAKYAQLGLSGSTMEQQDLSGAESANLAQTFQVASSLTNTGLQELGLAGNLRSTAASGENSAILANANLTDSELAASAGIYSNIMKTQMEQDTALQQALANFAGQFAIGQGLATRGAGGGGPQVPEGGWTDGLGNVFDKYGQLIRAAGGGVGSAVGSAIGAGAKGLFGGASDSFGPGEWSTAANSPGLPLDPNSSLPWMQPLQMGEGADVLSGGAGMQGAGADAIYGGGEALMGGGAAEGGAMALAEAGGFEELLSALAFLV